MKKPLPLLFLFLAIVLGSCATGQQALKQGDYERAILEAVSRLRMNGESKKAVATLERGYPLALDYYLNAADRSINGAQAFRWERAAQAYGTLNRIADEIERCPACLASIPAPRHFAREEQEALGNAAEERYRIGLSLVDPNDRHRSKEAVGHFEKARQLIPNYKDAIEQARQAREYATLHVVVELQPSPVRDYRLNYTPYHRQVFDQLANQVRDPYIRFYMPQDAQRSGVQPDQRVSLRLERFQVGKTYLRERIENVERDSVVVGHTTVDGQRRPVYGKVKAQLTTFEQTVTATGTWWIGVADTGNRRNMVTNAYTGEFVWVDGWATFKGDERALTQEQKEMVEHRKAPPPPPQNFLQGVSELVLPDVVGLLRNHFRQF